MPPLLIEDSTHYQYSSPVYLEPHGLLIRPKSGCDIQVASSRLTITSEPLKVS